MRICPGSGPDGLCLWKGLLRASASSAAHVEGFVIPVTVDNLAANGLLEEEHCTTVLGALEIETLTARKGDIAGLAIASDERIEAFLS